MHVYEMWDPLKFQANPVQILCNNISILCVYALNLHSDIILKGLPIYSQSKKNRLVGPGQGGRDALRITHQNQHNFFNTNDILTSIFIINVTPSWFCSNFFSSTQYHRSRAYFVSAGQKWTSHLVGWWWNLWWWLLNINSDHPVVPCRAWFYNFISFQDDCQKTWNFDLSNVLSFPVVLWCV